MAFYSALIRILYYPLLLQGEAHTTSNQVQHKFHAELAVNIAIVRYIADQLATRKMTTIAKMLDKFACNSYFVQVEARTLGHIAPKVQGLVVVWHDQVDVKIAWRA